MVISGNSNPQPVKTIEYKKDPHTNNQETQPAEACMHYADYDQAHVQYCQDKYLVVGNHQQPNNQDPQVS